MKQQAENRKVLSIVRRVLLSKVFITGVSLVCLYAAAGFLLAPYLITRLVPNAVGEKLDSDVRMGKVRLNPFLMCLESSEFGLYEKDGSPIAGYERFFIDLQVSSLFRWAWTFKTISLEKPVIHLVVEPDGSLNLAKMVPAASTTPEAPAGREEAAKPLRLLLRNIEIQEGAVHITDQRLSIPAELDIRPLTIRLNEISTLPERKGPYSLAATTGDGESIQWIGELALHPFQSRGRLRFGNIKASTLWKFARDAVRTQAPKGLLSLETSYVIDLDRFQPVMALNDLNFRIRGLGLQLPDEDSPFFELAEMDMAASQVDLSGRRIQVEKVFFDGGHGRIRVDEEGVLNVSTLLGATAMNQTPAAAESKTAHSVEPAPTQESPWTVQLEEIAFRNIAVDHEDRHRVPFLNAGIANIEGMLRLEGVAGGPAARWDLGNINFDFSRLRLQNPQSPDPEIHIARLSLKDGYARLEGQELGISAITMEGGDIHVVREADGGINLLRLLAPANAADTDESSRQETPEKNPWRFLVKTLQFSDLTAVFSDRTVKAEAPIVQLDNLACTVSAIDGSSPMDIRTTFDVRQGGAMEVSAVVDPVDGTAQADILIRKLELPAFQPYLEPYVNLRLAAGAFSTQGRLVYGGEKKTPQVGYEGGLDISGFQLLEAATDEPVYGWEHLRASKLKFMLQPDLFEIEDLKVFQMDGRFIIADDGTVRLSDIVKRSGDDAIQAEAPASSAQTDGAAFPIRVHMFRIEDSSLFFADYSLNPQFAARIHQLNGRIAGISSKRGSRTEIALDGRVDDYGVSKINGAIDVFNPTAFTDIAVVFRNLEMTRMTSYSGKFVGRKIDSGKLSLDLKYTIENKKLKGDNQIIVERIKLGERVESPNAVSLPLNLAVALLEDSEGVIDIGLPVKGDLENPEFSFGPLIWKAFVNVIKKIASAPFRALGALLGSDSENLDAVAFDPGASDISPPELEKLLQLAAALKKRPNLKLMVQGCYSEAMDGLAFRELNIRRRLSERMGIALGPEEDPGPVDFGNPRAMEALAALFVERFGEAELKAIREQATPPDGDTADDSEPSDPENATHDTRLAAETMVARLVENEGVDSLLLKQLAEERARHIMDELSAEGGLDADRMAAKEVHSLEPHRPLRAKLDLTPLQ